MNSRKIRQRCEWELCGLATAERVLERYWGDFFFSRFQLRRLCMAGEIPCQAVRSGRRTRYMVRPVDVVRRFGGERFVGPRMERARQDAVAERFADGGVFCAREGVCHG